MKSSLSEIHNIKIMGTGSKVMMFAHGFGCDQIMWRYITPAFEKDYKLVLGSGKADKNMTLKNIIL
ncbi:MAG: alpha/beta fold hydrolase [Chitinophagaceae bacterium]